MFEGRAFQRTRTAPTGYERVRILFHGIRTAQTISALIVGSFLIYFIWALHQDDLSWPWTFIVLVVTSFLTIIALTMTITMHALTGLNPRFNLIINSVLLFLWALGFGMLSYWAWVTMTHMCDIPTWHDNTGVMVCKIYKALFSFSLIGTVSALAAVALDFHIHKLHISRGAHMRLDDIDKKRTEAVRGPFTDGHARESHDEEGFPSRHSEAFEVPQRLYGSQPDRNHAERGGYAHPDAHLDYDTGYHGGHQERAYGN